MDLSNAVVFAASRAHKLLNNIENEYSLWSNISCCRGPNCLGSVLVRISLRLKVLYTGLPIRLRWFDGCIFLSGIELMPTLKLLWI